MNTMNCVGKVRIRSLEELNSGINLYTTNFAENVSTNDSILPGIQQSEIKSNHEEQTTQLQEEYVLFHKSTNFVDPTMEGYTTNSTQQQAIRMESKTKLPVQSDLIKIYQADTAFPNLENDRTQSIQTNSQNCMSFLDNLITDSKPKQVNQVFVESNNESDVIELSDDSICLMEYVETVFDNGCNGDALNCICSPIRLRFEEEKCSGNPEVSHGDHDYLDECERPDFDEKQNNSSFDNTENQQNDLEIIHVSTKSNLDEKIDYRPSPQKTESIICSKSENSNISLDGVLLNQFVSNKRVIAGTAFAVDALKYGQTEDVSAIFLTHLHSHHGLKGNFAKPIYLSRITANILREIVSVNESMLNVMDLNNTVTIDGVKVTALDANYCPGSIMLLFKLSSGLSILYTGDFRASSEMELNPFLRAERIDLLYLDTVYISSKISSQSQEKSIFNAITIIRKFKFTHIDKRILFLFGHIALGNEELWLEIADRFDFKVWTDEFRFKMLAAIGNEEYTQRFVPNAKQADMHLIQHSSINCYDINEYWKTFKDAYDIVLAIQPKQWADSKCRQFHNGEINIAEVEYSGHSNETEIRKFLAFLQPKRVIAIGACGKNQKKCPEVPLSWYKQKWFSPVKKQASMYDFFKVKPNK